MIVDKVTNEFIKNKLGQVNHNLVTNSCIVLEDDE